MQIVRFVLKTTLCCYQIFRFLYKSDQSFLPKIKHQYLLMLQKICNRRLALHEEIFSVQNLSRFFFFTLYQHVEGNMAGDTARTHASVAAADWLEVSDLERFFTGVLGQGQIGLSGYWEMSQQPTCFGATWLLVNSGQGQITHKTHIQGQLMVFCKLWYSLLRYGIGW